MPNIELQHRVRLALSWRAEARRLDAAARERFESGALEAGRYKYLSNKFAGQIHDAQQALDALRRAEGAHAARIGAELRDCLNRRAAISQQVKEGSIAHGTAAAEIRRLDEEIAALRDAIGEFNTLLTAEEPGQVGGVIHCALEDYPSRLAAAELLAGPETAPRRRAFTSIQRRLAVVVLIFVLLGAGAVYFIYAHNQTVDLAVAWDPRSPGELTVTCANRGASDFLLYVPEPRPGEMRQSGTHVLRALEPGPDGAEVALATSGAWTVEGRATQYSNPQRILAGRTARYVLDLGRIERPRAGLGRIVIEIRGPSDRVIRRGAAEVGGRLD